MPSVHTPSAAVRGRVAGVRAVSRDARTDPSSRPGRLDRPRRKLHEFLAGLNKLLVLGDFSRGDIFRD